MQSSPRHALYVEARSTLFAMSTATSETGEKGAHKSKQLASDGVGAAEYPSNQKRILIMAAVYLAMFLVVLVSLTFRTPVETQI